jgi:hypothetical protein
MNIEVKYNAGCDIYPKWGIYRFCNDSGKKYWLGVRRLSRTSGFTPMCVCPSSIWSDLQKAAIEQGIDPLSFRTPKAEKKVSKRRSAPRKKVGISIFF